MDTDTIGNLPEESTPPEKEPRKTLHPALVQLTGMHLVGGRGRTTRGGEIVAISIGAACIIVVLGAIVYWVWKLAKRRRALNTEYQKILPKGKQQQQHQADVTSSQHGATEKHPPTLSMRTIPFTVPAGTRGPRPGDQRLVEEGGSTSGGGSEPSTPSTAPTGRGSMESLSSAGGGEAAFRGAYALGSIDPSLYKMADVDDDYEFPDDHVGRIWFAVEYENEAEKLTVTLMKAKNLPSRVLGNTNGCDPFVRLYLMPDERRYLQTKCKKKTCNPKFEESFVFQVSSRSMEERVLRMTVYDVDRHRKHVVIGHALYPLRAHAHTTNERVVIWRDLEREVSETVGEERGELHIALCYNNHQERITVGIFDGKNFKKPDSPIHSGDFYVKVTFNLQNKPQKTKKTDIVRRTHNPTFHESFSFKLPVNSLDLASVTVTGVQSVSGGKDKPVGRVVLGSFMFVRGKELDHWNEMVANQKETINMWHTLT